MSICFIICVQLDVTEDFSGTILVVRVSDKKLELTRKVWSVVTNGMCIDSALHAHSVSQWELVICWHSRGSHSFCIYAP